MDAESIWKQIKPGVLTDKNLLELGAAGLLVVEGFDPAQVQQTCYELRVGTTAYSLSKTETRRKQQLVHKDGGTVPLQLRPRDVVTVITLEKVELPGFVIGRIFTKGSLFSVGISPAAIYIDPGFAGNLGITLVNNANRVFTLSYGESIAKAEFTKMRRPVEVPYRGVHFFASEIWPFQMEHLLPPRELNAEQIRSEELFEEEMNMVGEPLDLLVARVRQMRSDLARLRRVTRFLLYLVVGGAALFLGGQLAMRIVETYRLAPDSMQASIVNGLLQVAGALLAVVLAWVLSKWKGL